MDPAPEYSLFLERILEELDTKHSSVSYQDLCKSLCARFDLAHLAKLRSLLFYTACLDPSFPATLFKDKMKCSMDNQQSKKIMVAADIVTMFNLIRMNDEEAKEKLPVAQRPKFHKHQSIESCRSDSEICKYSDCVTNCDLLDAREHSSSRTSPCPKSNCSNPQQFIQTSDPNFLLGVNKEMKCRAASLDRLQMLHQFSNSSPPPCEMQSTYFPMDIDSESTDQDSLHMNLGIKETFISNAEPFTVHSCVQKRTIFKEDFHNLAAFTPQVLTTDSQPSGKGVGGHNRRETHKPATFFNHSFELPYSNPYFEPISSPVQEKRRAKHESLDDLQTSTYFGPTTVMEAPNLRRPSSRQSKQIAWPVKSLSLNTEEGPNFEASFFNGKQSKDNHRLNVSNMEKGQHYQCSKEQTAISPSGFGIKSNGQKTKEMSSKSSGPSAEKRDGMKRFKDKSMNCTSLQAVDIDNTSSVGTQTDQPDQRKKKEFSNTNHMKYGERHTFKHSDEDSEVVSDDISDIFRFLDDMSVSGSTVIQSSRYNSNGSLSQVTRSEGDSSPEHNMVAKYSKKFDKLFYSQESADDDLKASVCKLVLRIGEIEKKLETLSGVRDEISQVLSKLNKLDEKIQEPETNNKQNELDLANEDHSDNSVSPRIFQCHTTGHAIKQDNNPEWCCSDVSGSNSESLRVKALKKSLFTRRSSRSLTEENSATESKIASISNSPRDWRPTSYSISASEEMKEKERESKERHRKSKETDRQYEIPQAHRSSKQPKDSYLIEQVFSPHPFSTSVKSHKSNPLYTDMRLTEISESKRPHPSWTIEQYKRNSGEKGKIAVLDLQTQESLNPNNLEFWMEDIYTPGYDSLLKRKEAEFRRAKVCKIGALIAAAVCTVILVIVVPICTMKS
ncbi:major intrinsically disordered Notch2-binding receptor 1-like [Acipenser oxyrinchus oxyrinchus]|uniref:Major intrinsically disordered Notch2-binding receptor 1-like n=1 Tax=Acipenser oxyrinchus oxyrinchus TaxID=40147 RepID=A0AAD8CV33_ACIOX|nr:major intrinsically disordered Notch2-binding receptor 1-like [Acipenser oxyrinchus oxyrinchus]